jgi:glycosyltransferase involved in cell wall biosynthesis
MEGYDFEVVPNASPDPGTHHRKGLINPGLVDRVKGWKPDVVHITGYNYISHGQAIQGLSKAGIPVLFRGDSHLLDGRGAWWRWQLKKWFVSRIYRCPSAFPYVGQANRDYYRAFGVPERKLFPVPHTIEVGRFAEPNDDLEAKALVWRRQLGIPDDHFVFLYAAKLEPRKRPMELLDAFLRADLPKTTLVFVGSGELEEALKERVERDQETKRQPSLRTEDGPKANGLQSSQLIKDEKTAGLWDYGTTGRRDKEPSGLQDHRSTGLQVGAAEGCKLHAADCGHRVVFVPFQNQSAMPVVYRLGDALVLPSGYGETWGLAVNEAQACGRPSLVSDCVGCARDIVREVEDGMLFRTDDWDHCIQVMKQMVGTDWRSKREKIRAAAWEFDTARGVEALLRCMRQTA